MFCYRFIVSHGCIKPLCNLLFARLGITIRVLDALDEILKVGEKEAKSVGGPNKYALEVEECSGKSLIFIALLAFNLY